jgi:DNA polymerase-3 subunit epsilon
MAANLLGHLVDRLRAQHGLATVTHALLCRLQKVPAAKVGKFLEAQQAG